MKSTVWYEKYRPQCLDDVVLPEQLKQQLQQSITDNALPNLGFWSSEPGLGKTSTANAIVQEMQALGHEAMWINASLEKGIDTLRGKIQGFATSASVDGLYKVVVLDECLEENERVIVLEDGKEVYRALKDFAKGKIYNCVSMNLETGKVEPDTCEVISDKEDDVYEIELEDGRVIKVTADHPMIVNNNGKLECKTIEGGLSIGDDLACREEYDLPSST